MSGADFTTKLSAGWFPRKLPQVDCISKDVRKIPSDFLCGIFTDNQQIFWKTPTASMVYAKNPESVAHALNL